MGNKIFMLITLLSVSFYASAIELTIDSALIKATKPGQTVTAGFMKIKSPTTLNIKNISTSVAGTIEVHTMKMEKGPYGDSIMKMRKIDDPIIEANKEFILMPGADHLMIFEVKKELKMGDTVLLKFTLIDTNKKEYTKDIPFNVY